MVLARDSTLMDLTGVGPVVAARILADVGDVARFADRNRFASWTGTAPLDASSGEQIRHRLSRAGNRRANHMIHIAAASQLRHDTPGRAYYRRKLAAGKTPMEAMRCLKRRISDALYRQLVNDAKTASAAAAADMDAGPGGHCGAALQSSAAGSHPHTGTSDQPQPGPATQTLPAPTPGTEDHPIENAATRLLTSEGSRCDAGQQACQSPSGGCPSGAVAGLGFASPWRGRTGSSPVSARANDRADYRSPFRRGAVDPTRSFPVPTTWCGVRSCSCRLSWRSPRWSPWPGPAPALPPPRRWCGSC